MLLILFFTLEGTVKIFLAFMIRPLVRWEQLFFNGFTSLLLAIIVWAGWPEIASWVLGLIQGINILFMG